MKNKSILIVAAHPDDELLGCGGTIARYIQEGYQAYSLILGEGITSRDKKRDLHKRKDDLENLHQHMQKANGVLGITQVFSHQFPDNRFDSVTQLDIVKTIEDLIFEVKPALVFTHFGHDLNIDHQVTYQAVLTATRPLPHQMVKQIYAFETLSSTDYNYPLTFSPDTFVDISATLKIKQKAMAEYTSEVCAFPHPRSLKGIELLAAYRGMQVGLRHAEAFMSVRNII